MSKAKNSPVAVFVFLLTCSVCLLLVGCQPQGAPKGTVVKVQRVLSGQTLEVVDTSQQPPLIQQVRLLSIEAPDLQQQPWGPAAKNHLERMISKVSGQQFVLQSVLLQTDPLFKDKYGRQLAYVWHDGVLINEQLAAEGYVLAAPRSDYSAVTPIENMAVEEKRSRLYNSKYDRRIVRAEEKARILGKGLWNPLEPMRLTPSEFRQQNP
ncbi:MAG: thermonuclease family protein [Kastovskya adunca ATA6-11-RM4]|jgi:micrococcal nuclease|nr:thermonuclease family protein [Kastovskya adunca ATA6-11-RM4]